MTDPRKGNAFYYDLDATPLDDIPFYQNEVGTDTSVLELGCGTGRTLIPIATQCREITGIDYSADMVARCKSKLPNTLTDKCKILVGDITQLDLGRKFELLIAPYRVMQALETDQELDGFFSTIERHLSPTGSCILNVFNPKKKKDEMLSSWAKPNEEKRWDKTLPDNSRVVHSEWKDPMVLFVRLIYRKYRDEKLTDEFVQKIKMRCYYPDEFKTLIASHGFHITASWGGYQGEKYGEGPELIARFSRKDILRL